MLDKITRFRFSKYASNFLEQTLAVHTFCKFNKVIKFNMFIKFGLFKLILVNEMR